MLPSVTRSGSLLGSARASRPGELCALLPAVFERQDRLIPERNMGPPRSIQTSTPITPAMRPRGHAARTGEAGKSGDPRDWRDQRGAAGRSPATIGFGARSREEGSTIN